MNLSKTSRAHEYYLNNKAYIKDKAAAWSKANPDKRKEIRRKWRNANIDLAKTIEKASRIKHKAAKTLRQIAYRKNNPGLSAAYCAKRRACKLKATPKWLTAEHLREIETYYEAAKELQWLSSEPLHVDHIMPLQGEYSSGLHVPWNLQILPRSLNCKKSNKI